MGHFDAGPSSCDSTRTRDGDVLHNHHATSTNAGNALATSSRRIGRPILASRGEYRRAVMNLVCASGGGETLITGATMRYPRPRSPAT